MGYLQLLWTLEHSKLNGVFLTWVQSVFFEEAFSSDLRASPFVLYCKPESRKKWKDVNCGSGQQRRSLYSSFIYRLKLGFGKFFRGACNRFWNILLRKGTQIWEHDILMITGLQAYKTTGDALTYSK
jgi:hypothetical protein